MASVITKYPLDKTGTSLLNKVSFEFTVDATNKGIVLPPCGAFYADTLNVIDAINLDISYVKGSGFYALEPYPDANLLLGKDVACIVYVKLPIGTKVRITVNAVGGSFSTTTPALMRLIETLDIDSRPVQWLDILYRPDEYPAAPHLHPLSDVYGWEYVTLALEKISSAIKLGDQYTLDQYKREISLMLDTTLTQYTNDTLSNQIVHITTAEINLDADAYVDINVSDIELYDISCHRINILTEITDPNSNEYGSLKVDDKSFAINIFRTGVVRIKNITTIRKESSVSIGFRRI